MITVDIDTLIVGGGQAGLALGYLLRRRGLDFTIVDAHPEIGDEWRNRWDSLRLFTPRRYALPGMSMPGDPSGYPGKDEVADYLAAYAEHFDLEIHTDTRVVGLWPSPGGRFIAETPTRIYNAARVVLATGAFQAPAVPAFGARLAEGITQVHSSEYRNPQTLAIGDVLVVGAGNTGVQIADELARNGRGVTLAASAPGRSLPQRWLGRDLFWWLSGLGVMAIEGDNAIGRRLQSQEPLIGANLTGLWQRVTRVDRISGASGDYLVTEQGWRIGPDVVVWATGFRRDYTWLDLPVLYQDGSPVHRHGVTPWPGLYFLGLPWQRSRGSALLGWVARDARELAERLAIERPSS